MTDDARLHATGVGWPADVGVQSDGPQQFDKARAAQVLRDEIVAIPGNEGAFDGVEPSDVMVDLNATNPSLTGSVPADVVEALWQGRLIGGMPERFLNPTADLA